MLRGTEICAAFNEDKKLVGRAVKALTRALTAAGQLPKAEDPADSRGDTYVVRVPR